ncbi:MAG: cytochrome b/b6 domain-containing protein [Oryzomonas sp.]|uniref:cytochrome b/b6 domain-containing protein n=1 Tax=Oryzomonas sp. TaxID=2855186 RepID=UPI00285056D3|nr:cytochrome b/b6 domain-containing protein [Oryzomonas sp.]MDR3578699.1 cytochrome b/b6 domain-containing protein [Oryzomonas sp.]
MESNGRSMARGCFLVLAAVLLVAQPSFGARLNDECLQCHGKQNISRRGGAHLYIDPVQFADTTHNAVGCTTCHDSVTDRHPYDGTKPSHATCKECHAAVAQEYAQSLHARNATCADCHNPHKARGSAYVSGVAINAVCSRCHILSATVKSHQKWLPQAGLHLDSLPCVTCHTGSKGYYINLFVEKEDQKGGFHLATYDELTRLAGENSVSSLIDANGDSRVSLKELRRFNIKSRDDGLRLRGMMMPEVMTHSYQILDNRWDCTFCHVSGVQTQQTSFVSFPTKSGAYSRMPVEKGAILDVLYGTPDFYMTGATRSLAFSIIGGLIIACGIVIPLGHGFVRFLTRRRREHSHHEPAHEVIVYLQPTPVRIWHWIHALSIVTLCVTGIQIRFADAVNLFGSYRAAVYLHNAAGIVVGLSMVYWVLYYIVISHTIGRIYFPTGDEVKHGLVRQAVFYAFNYFRGKPNPFHATPENKFNALQKMAYLVIMFVFMPLVIVTGILLLDIQPLRRMLFMLGGIKLIDGLHFFAACCLCAFAFFHFYLTTLGPTPFSEIRTMWTGWEKEEEPEEAAKPVVD